MSHNRATIYSNGIADFQRVFSITAGQQNRISIPVRQQHLSDVLASLTVTGNATIDGPPSFQPANVDDGNVVISANNSLSSLAAQLIGAGIEITVASKVIAGKLVGIQNQQVAGAGEPITEESLVILTEQGLTQYSMRQIENLHFVDESIRSEISKALDRRLREIKPNSTFIELDLSTKKKSAEAIIQYTIPAAAWKISYRLLLISESKIELQGHAIVDNNTDEDWKDFMIAVVMGQPITFSTDVAESKTPRRKHVNVVQNSALGSVEVEDAISEIELSSPADAPRGIVMAAGGAAPQKMMKRSASAPRGRSAKIEEANVNETGDFCIFESAKPVSIDAHRSAIIPVFQTELDNSQPVLHFKSENHPERPYRTIQFENSTEHSLGRGVCTVYDQSTYAGNCILPATQPGGDALLPHALETAVRVNKKAGKIESRRIGIHITDGIAYESYHKLLRTEYLIDSRRNEQFEFVLDHKLRLDNCKIACQLHRESSESVDIDSKELKQGRRAEFTMLPNEVIKVIFVETCVAKSQMLLTGDAPGDENFRVQWLYDNLIESNTSLAQDPAISRCVELKRMLDETHSKIKHAHDELQRLNARQERLRKNIKTGVGDQQLAKWQDDLARAEDNIVQLEEEHLTELNSEREDNRRDLYDALRELAIEWSE